MTKQNNDFEQMIKENLYREAEAIEREVEMSGTEDMSDGQMEAIRQKLKNRIDAYERDRAYARLSEEDREALELGRRIREERSAGKKSNPLKRWRRYVSAAAVLVLVCFFGVSSMGHGEKFASEIEQMIGERKLVQIESDERNKILENDEEERAYQEIKDQFGSEPIRIVKTKDMQFIKMKLDESLQVAQLLYQYKNENFWYAISAGYYRSSFGFDTEDEIIEQKDVEIEGISAELTVYRRKKSGEEKCLVHFTYQNLHYFLTGNISKEDFLLILKYFYLF